MESLRKFTRQTQTHLFLILIVNNVIILSGWWIGENFAKIENSWLLPVLIFISLVTTSLLTYLGTDMLLHPITVIAQAILHVSPDTADSVEAPNLTSVGYGHQLITELTSDVFNLASLAEKVKSPSAGPQTNSEPIANNFPLPLLILDKSLTITFINTAALNYLHKKSDETLKKNVYEILDFSFSTAATLDDWLKKAMAGTTTLYQSWERVRLNQPENKMQLDLAAYYDTAKADHPEVMLVMFDHSAQYARDDQATSLVAVAVHELRTPLTLLRGYIEVFEEELHGKVNVELEMYMHKMKASARQMTAFVNNILNLSRVEDDQLVLRLHKDNWSEIINTVVNDMSLVSEVRGIKLAANVPLDIPPVGVDRTSVYEVLSNLLDNAIKYSNKAAQITINVKLNSEGMIETTIQDYGIGIPANVLPHLFEKFYRSHRSKAQVSGTGIGLYICKTIVDAHGGSIWVRSEEGKGAIFGFTVMPYTKLAQELQNNDNKEIVRTAHGWIKNHTIYRG